MESGWRDDRDAARKKEPNDLPENTIWCFVQWLKDSVRSLLFRPAEGVRFVKNLMDECLIETVLQQVFHSQQTGSHKDPFTPEGLNRSSLRHVILF